MTEKQSPSEAENTAPMQAAPAAAPTSSETAASVAAHPVFKPIPLALLALAILAIAIWWVLQMQIGTLREDLAKRLQSADLTTAETKLLAQSVQESAKEIQAKVILLEGKQAESQSQQLALEQLYQDLSKNRDEWALAEIEQVLSTASQQLQLAGNVQGALLALQNADARLAKSDKPQFISVRRAIAKDIEKLKALPLVDISGIALRIDSVVTQIDYIPLWADEKPSVPSLAPKQPLRMLAKPAGKDAKSTPQEAGWSVRLQDIWQSLSTEMWNETRQLVRVRSVETPDALLLAPPQAYFVRENLKLRLLNARLALLARNESIFRSDLIAAQDAINKYFDTRAKQTQAVQLMLRQVQGSNLSIEMPTLAESLNAIRNFKVKP